VPCDLVLEELLETWFQRTSQKCPVVYGSQSHDVNAWEPTGDSVHQRATDAAEVAVHLIVRGDAMLALIFRELILAADVLYCIAFDGKVAGEHRRCDLAIIITMTDELCQVSFCVRRRVASAVSLRW